MQEAHDHQTRNHVPLIGLISWPINMGLILDENLPPPPPQSTNPSLSLSPPLHPLPQPINYPSTIPNLKYPHPGDNQMSSHFISLTVFLWIT